MYRNSSGERSSHSIGSTLTSSGGSVPGASTGEPSAPKVASRTTLSVVLTSDGAGPMVRPIVEGPPVEVRLLEKTTRRVVARAPR